MLFLFPVSFSSQTFAQSFFSVFAATCDTMCGLVGGAAVKARASLHMLADKCLVSHKCRVAFPLRPWVPPHSCPQQEAGVLFTAHSSSSAQSTEASNRTTPVFLRKAPPAEPNESCRCHLRSLSCVSMGGKGSACFCLTSTFSARRELRKQEAMMDSLWQRGPVHTFSRDRPVAPS